jgi:predicted phosphoribosyltransferase
MAIGLWYADFAQVDDEEVVEILAEARARHAAQPHEPAAAPPA